MNKIIISIIVFGVVAGASVYFYKSGQQEQPSVASTTPQTTTSDSSQNTGPRTLEAGEDEYDYDEDIQPANKVYNNAEEALEKVLSGVDEFDDIILEQFAELDDSCSWCADFYQLVKEQISTSTDENEKSYLAELLSITGKKENIQALLDFYSTSSTDTDKDIFLEAIELTYGDDSVVELLAGHLDTEDENLKESAIAGITNHGSRLAIEKLYSETTKQGDPEGYYSYGIGIGEVIPDQESLPYLSELAFQKDEYSHLAIKALLNYGDEGLKEVVNIISGSHDQNTNDMLLEDALDHVSYDDDTEKYVDDLIKTSNHPDVVKFAKSIKEDMQYEFEEDDEEDEEEL